MPFLLIRVLTRYNKKLLIVSTLNSYVGWVRKLGFVADEFVYFG